jgi:hypothetical protein
MTESDYAAGQLRVIRALMERATIYRSISVPTALIGGLLSLGAFAVIYYLEQMDHHTVTAGEFVVVWLVTLALTGLSNAVFLWLGSARRREPFFSPGMRLATLSLAPAFLTAGLLTLTVHRPMHLAISWILLYGLGLLGTQHFAPRSLVALGLAFFFAGCGLVAGGKHLFLLPGQTDPSVTIVAAVLAATFGGFHLVYAMVVWARGEDEVPASTSEAAHV